MMKDDILQDTVTKLADEDSYKQLFHAYRDEESLPSGEALKEIVDLCRAILFPGYYGPTRISRQTIRFHTGVLVSQLHDRLTHEIHAGLCFADTPDSETSEQTRLLQAQQLSEAFIAALPEIRRLLATDAEATFD